MPLSQEQVRLIKYLYEEEGLGMQIISEQVKISSATVKKYVDKWGLVRGKTELPKQTKTQKKMLAEDKKEQKVLTKAHNTPYVMLDKQSTYAQALPKRQTLENNVLETALTIWERVNDIIALGFTQHTKYDKDDNPISFEAKLGLREYKLATEIMEKLGTLVGMGVKFDMNMQVLIQQLGLNKKEDANTVSPQVTSILDRISKLTGEEIKIVS